MTTITLPPGPQSSNMRGQDMVSAAIFAAFTYLLFTYRAQLRYGAEALLVDPKRLISTMIGAAMLFVALHFLMPVNGRAPKRPGLVIASLVPASAVMLLVRWMLDQLVPVSPNDFAGSVRFVSVWGGYFGLWISATLALRYASLPSFRLPGKVAPAVTFGRVMAESAPISVAPRRREDQAAWDDVLDWLGEEMQAMPDADRRAIADRLITRAGYENADPIAGGDNQRVAIARRLASRVRPRV